jgi:hypothetical protein
MRLPENTVLWTRFGLTRMGVIKIGPCNEKRHRFQLSLNILNVIKLRKMRLVGHIASGGDEDSQTVHAVVMIQTRDDG